MTLNTNAAKFKDLVCKLKENGISDSGIPGRNEFVSMNGKAFFYKAEGVEITDKIIELIKSRIKKEGIINLKKIKNEFHNEFFEIITSQLDESFIETSYDKLIETLVKIAKNEVEIIIPIIGVEVDRELKLLEYRLISKNAFSRKYKQAFSNSYFKNENLDEFTKRADSFVIIKDRGDYSSLKEYHLIKLDNALNIIRLYIPLVNYNGTDKQVWILDEKILERNTIYFKKNGRIVNVSASLANLERPFNLDSILEGDLTSRKHILNNHYSEVNKVILKSNSLSKSVAFAINWMGAYCKEKDLKLRYLYLIFALEAIFPNDSQNYSSITASIAERGAILIGKNVDERKKIFGVLTKAYGKRSSIVHGSDQEISKNDTFKFYPLVFTLIIKSVNIILKNNLTNDKELKEYFLTKKFSIRKV